MSFLQPFVLAGLALALVPVVIHLLNRLRHRTVEWGAMRFLVQASKRTRGHARLRHLIIMLMRMLAIAALVLGVARPLSGGFFGSWNASVDTALILLDRSPSMAAQDLQSGRSRRSVAVDRVVSTLEAGGVPQHVVLVDSGSGKAVPIESLEVLSELPDVGPSDASADIPALLQAAVDHIEANESGRTELWICSDGQRHDWSPDGAQWAALRGALSGREQSVRVHLLHFAGRADDNLSVRIEEVRRETDEDGDSLRLDIVVRRRGGQERRDIELNLVLNGARTVLPLQLEGDELRLRDHRIPLAEGEESGWGQVELPEDGNPRDNLDFFAYGPRTLPRSLIVSEDPARDRALSLLAAPASDAPSMARVVRPEDLGGVDWSEPALLLWSAPLPTGSAAEAVERFVDSGGAVVFLPPSSEGLAGEAAESGAFRGVRWGPWKALPEARSLEQWRDDDGLLRNALDGRALPVAEVEVRRVRELQESPTSLTPMAQLVDGSAVLSRLATRTGSVHFLGIGVGSQDSNAARQGVVLFVMVQRALEEGSARLSSVVETEVGRAVPLSEGLRWEPLAGWREGALSTQSPLVSGIYRIGERMAVRKRPRVEDEGAFLDADELSVLFEGVDHRVIQGDLDTDDALVQEIWRVFLAAMLIALLVEGLLSLPRKVRG